MLKMKFVRFLFVFIFLCTSLIVPMNLGLAIDTKSVLVYENNQAAVEAYKKAGFNVIEVYDEFFLSEVTSDQEALLTRKQVLFTEIVGIRDIRFDEFLFSSDGAKNFIYPEELKTKIGPIPAGRESFFILQFIGPIKNEWIDELKANGIKFYFSFQYSSFFICTTPEKAEEAKAKRYVRTVGYIPNYYKLSKELRKPNLSSTLNLNITTDPSIDLPKFFSSIQFTTTKYNFSKSDHFGFLRIQNFPLSLLYGLLDSANIVKIGVVNPIYTLNGEAAQVVGIRDLADTPFIGLNEGVTAKTVSAPPPVTYWPTQIVAVADTGLSTGDCNTLNPAFKFDNSSTTCLNEKVVAHFGYNDPNQSNPVLGDWSDYDVISGNPLGHGTHVSGTVLGDGDTANLRYRGMASKARIVMQSLKIPGSSRGLSLPGYTTIFDDAFDAGARIHTNSWGGGPNAYTADCQEIDQYLWDHPDFNILFAAGNSGFTSPTMLTQANSKNVISCGATENNSRGGNPSVMAYFSSGGNAGDGRIKPDVVSPGYSINSTYPTGTRTAPSNTYAYMAGTSMATPVTAGSLAVIREFFTHGAGETKINLTFPTGNPILQPTPLPLAGPSAAFLKAVLINGAYNEKLYYRSGTNLVQTISPSNISGWGRVDVRNACLPESNKIDFYDIQTINGFTAAGTSHLYTYKVENYAPLKLTLTYTDFPGIPGATKALVNDLDVVIADPNGNLFYGNAFDTTTGYSVINPPTSSIDSRNNVEGIFIRSPIPGTYKIYVNATNISYGPQGYGMVIAGGVTPISIPPVPVPLNPRLRLTVVPGLVSIIRGQQASYQARVRSIDGASGAISFSVSIAEGTPLQLGISYVIEPLNPVLSAGGQAEALITFFTTGNTNTGDYHITISASTSTLTSNPVSVILQVKQEPYYDLSFAPSELKIRQGESIDSMISVIPYFGFSEDVRFFIEDPEGHLPPSITFTFAPTVTSINMQYRSILTVQTTQSTPIGDYIVLIHGKNITTDRELEITKELKLKVVNRENIYKTDVIIKSVPEAVEEDGDIKYRIQIKNVGNEPLVNNTLIFELDPNLQFLFSEPAGNFGDGKLYVGIRDLNPGACYPVTDCDAIRYPGFSDVDGDYMIVRAKVKPFKIKPQVGQLLISKFTFQSDPAYKQTFSVQTPLRVKQAGEYPLYFKVYFENLQKDGSYPVGKELSVRFRIDGGSGRYMYTWDWSDGEVIRDHEAGTEEIILKHTYTKAGIYRITIQARDNRGRYKRGEVILKVN